MSLTNTQVRQRFEEGKEGHNGRDSLRSAWAYPHGEEIAELQSYSTVIAIRRDSDGQVFDDGHSYSVTTTGSHGGGRGAYSFRSLAQLVGPDWYTHAEVVEELPHYGHHSEACEDRRAQEIEAFYQLPPEEQEATRQKVGSPYAHKCDVECDPGQELPKAAEAQWYRWALLRFPEYDVLCGGERGPRYTGQLFAVRLPERANSILAALEMLKPNGADADTARQGELFFFPHEGEPPNERPMPTIKSYDGEEAAAWPTAKAHRDRDGTYSGPGEIPIGKPQQRRYLGGPGDYYSHAASRLRASNGAVYVKGYVTHDQHNRLHLKGWHRVVLGQGVEAYSADVSQPMGSGQGGAD